MRILIPINICRLESHLSPDRVEPSYDLIGFEKASAISTFYASNVQILVSMYYYDHTQLK
jgi:hypothetical protein